MADVEKQSLVVIEPPAGGGGGSGCGSTLVIIFVVLAVLGVGCYFLYVYILEPIISPIQKAANAVSNPLDTVGGLIP